ncbi:hypothetical protein TNCV_2499911 [Trichonephila clavipes]|nr:hypothetical protein TNCV_2499911 [Trichonephila clavipes]
MDFVILNQVQASGTTPELAPPLSTANARQRAKRGQVIVFERSHRVGYFAPSTPNHFEHTGTSPLSLSLFHWLTSSSSAVATDSPAKRTGAAFPGRFSRPEKRNR